MVLKAAICASMLLWIPASEDATKPATPVAKPEASSDNAKTEVAKAEVVKTEEAEQTEAEKLGLIAIEANIVAYTNAERVKRGLPPLKVDQGLMQSARKHGIWMARRHRMVHSRQNLGENIAYGQPTSAAVVRAWMNSSGHRANILNRSYKTIGVAAYRTASGRIYWCQQFRR